MCFASVRCVHFNLMHFQYVTVASSQRCMTIHGADSSAPAVSPWRQLIVFMTTSCLSFKIQEECLSYRQGNHTAVAVQSVKRAIVQSANVNKTVNIVSKVQKTDVHSCTQRVNAENRHINRLTVRYAQYQIKYR